MSLFKAIEFGDAVGSHRFGSFLLETINATWNCYSELITEFTTQPRGYGKTLDPIEHSESQHRVFSVQCSLTETTNIESGSPFRS